MALTYGQQAVIRYVEETTPGTTPTTPTLQLLSPETLSVAWMIDGQLQESRDIGDYDVHEYFQAKRVYGVKVSGHVYDVERLLDAFVDRTATGAPKSHSLEIIPNQDDATPQYYIARGMRADTVKFSGDQDGAQTVEIEFKGGVIDDPTTSPISATREDNTAFAGDPIKTFLGIVHTKDGNPLAAILGAFEYEIKNNITPKYASGSSDPAPEFAAYGKREITGSADISLDDGASTQWLLTKANTPVELRLEYGTTGGDQVVVLEDCYFDSLEVEIDTDTDVLMQDVPFKVTTLSRTTL